MSTRKKIRDNEKCWWTTDDKGAMKLAIKVPLEKTVVNNILKYLNNLDGCRAIKVHGGSYCSGEPDIDAVYHGKSLKLEVKRPGGKATKLQIETLRKWEAAGAVAAVVDSVEKVQELLQEEVIE